jgi:hypothetical protein
MLNEAYFSVKRQWLKGWAKIEIGNNVYPVRRQLAKIKQAKQRQVHSAIAVCWWTKVQTGTQTARLYGAPTQTGDQNVC